MENLLQAEQDTDEVYAQITLLPEADVRTYNVVFTCSFMF